MPGRVATNHPAATRDPESMQQLLKFPSCELGHRRAAVPLQTLPAAKATAGLMQPSRAVR